MQDIKRSPAIQEEKTQQNSHCNKIHRRRNLIGNTHAKRCSALFSFCKIKASKATPPRHFSVIK